MHIERLCCRRLRNLDAVDIVPQAPTIVLEGANGQGKTNILEALYLCATGRSFRQAQAKELVRHGEIHGRAAALLSRSDVRHEVQVDLALQSPGGRGRQRLSVDERVWQRASRLLSLINVVAFFPDDLRVIKGAPEERRRFFDRAAAGGSPLFVDTVLAYQAALKARNALLRAPSPPSGPMLAAYDAQLVRHGSLWVAMRAAALARLWPLAKEHLHAILPGRESRAWMSTGVGVWDNDATRSAELPLAAELTDTEGSHTDLSALGLADFASAFSAALRQGYARDRARGMTLSGPHRADLHLELDGRDTRLFASQGQQRAVVLALKLAELGSLAQRLRTAPILLLDDVSSELDAERAERLFDQVAAQRCQLWVSTTGSVSLPIRSPVHRLQVKEGAVANMGQ